MSSERLTNNKILNTESIDINKKNISEKTRTTVDINNLLLKLREKKKSQKQENLLFFGIFSSIVITIGIVAIF